MPDENIKLKQYLLGALSEPESEAVNLRIISDEAFAEELFLAENDLIEDYLEGSLSNAEVQLFRTNFLTSPERKQQLSLTRDLRRFAAQAAPIPEVKHNLFDWRPIFSIQWLRFAALATIVIAAVFGVWRFAIYQSDTDKGLAELRKAYSGQRPFESRSSANFEYAPLSDTRGNNTESSDERARARAERYLFDATENSKDAKSHQALGLFYLANKKFDDALKEFNLARASAPNNAKIHSDIGATYFEKSKQADLAEKSETGLQDLALSLEALNRALELDSSLLEALFDKALVLQKMQLSNQAKEAWEKYLEKDSTSPWADEARRNLELLKKQDAQAKNNSQVLDDFLKAVNQQDEQKAWEIASQTKELVTGMMIATQLTQKFLSANDGNLNDDENETLKALVFLGDLEKQNSGDQYFAELASFYKNSEHQQRQILFEAHNEMQQGHELILKANFTEALHTFNRAKELFLSAKDILDAQLVEHRICYCLTQLNKIQESNERLLALSKLAREHNYKWLETLAESWIGSNYSLLAEHSKAITHDKKSLEIAREIADTYSIQKAGSQLANEYWLIGDLDKTLSFIQLSLNRSNLYFLSSRQKSRNLLFATEGLYRFKFYDAAAAYSREEIQVAQDELKDNWLSHTAQTHLATIYGDEGQYQKAFQAVETSFKLADSLGDELMRQKQNTKSRLTLANLLRQSNNLDDAVNNYNQVISDYANNDFSINNYEALKGRLECYIGQQNDTDVKAEMPELLKMFDENRQTIAEESNRNTFFDNEQSVYDIATNYAFTKLKDPEQAFNYAENSRARSLLSLIQKKAPEPLVLAEFRQSIPTDLQVLYYAVVSDKVLIWHISKTDFSVADQSITSQDLDEKIRTYIKILTNKNDGRDAAKELYSILVQPIEPALEPEKSVCIIADKILLRVPFASLVSPETNRYFIEDHVLLYAPSASVLVDETEIARQKGMESNETILSVGNPSFSREEYPDLSDLPAATREANEVAAFYNSAKVYTGKEVYKSQIIDNLNRSDVVHLASHYVPNTAFPELSKFLLAPDDLTVKEISREKLARVRLMVLSACDTGFEKSYKGEGMIGAARAFLSLDVPMVIASQWSVDSAATAELMIKFHRYRKQEKLPTINALQRAQLEMLTNENPHFREPFYWAGFIPIGGYAEY